MSWSRTKADRWRVISPTTAAGDVDPYLVWADLTRMRCFSNLPEFEAKGRLPVLLRVDDRQRWEELTSSRRVLAAAAYDGQTFCTALVERGEPGAFDQLRAAGPFEFGVAAFALVLDAPALRKAAQ